MKRRYKPVPRNSEDAYGKRWGCIASNAKQQGGFACTVDVKANEIVVMNGSGQLWTAKHSQYR